MPGSAGNPGQLPIGRRGADEAAVKEDQSSIEDTHCDPAVSIFPNLAVHAIGLSGHDRAKGKSKPGIHTCGTRVTTFSRVLNLLGVCLVGHSMGSTVAPEAWLLSRELVTPLCLVTGTTWISNRRISLLNQRDQFSRSSAKPVTAASSRALPCSAVASAE